MWLLCVIIFFLILSIYSDTVKPNYFPPGPNWMPLFGNYLYFRQLLKKLKLTHLVWKKVAEEYGPLVGLRLGFDRLVIVSGQEMAQQVLNREEFEGRPDGFFFRLRSLGQRLGVAFVDGTIGQDQRRFCLQNLKEFGFGRSVMDQRIALETSELVSWLKIKCQDGPIRMDSVFDISILNTLWSMLAGKRYKLDDSNLHELLLNMNELFRINDMSGGLLNQLPFIRFVAPEKSLYNRTVYLLDAIIGFIRGTILEHKRIINSGETRDVIDAFLHKIEQRKNEKDSIYKEDQLVILLLDLFMAGSETTSKTLSFALLYLLHHTDIQNRAQKDLDLVVGKENQPTMEHRSKLIYIEAIIMEVQRICNVAPTSAAHRAKTDAALCGYRVPKDTIILVSLYSVHMDKNHWKDPEIFRPERFIDHEGKLIYDNWLMPFAVGKRRCLGESLARGSLFLFLSCIIHNFTIALPSGQPLPSLEPVDGATLSPLPFHAVLIPRF